MTSADGNGRTILDILTGRNKRDMTPLELQYHNPLEAKVGCAVTLEDPEFNEIRFFIEQIAVYLTEIGGKKYYHTDYCLKGTSLELEHPIRLRLRLVKDNDATNKLGHSFQLLHMYDDFGYDEEFHDYLNASDTVEVNEGDDGEALDSPRCYWRVDEATDSYTASQTTLTDDDGNGQIDDDELEHREVSYWDFSRLTEDEGECEILEYLWIEMDEETHYFNLFRGTEILADQVMVF